MGPVDSEKRMVPTKKPLLSYASGILTTILTTTPRDGSSHTGLLRLAISNAKRSWLVLPAQRIKNLQAGHLLRLQRETLEPGAILAQGLQPNLSPERGRRRWQETCGLTRKGQTFCSGDSFSSRHSLALPRSCLGFVPMAAERHNLKIKSLQALVLA